MGRGYDAGEAFLNIKIAPSPDDQGPTHLSGIKDEDGQTIEGIQVACQKNDMGYQAELVIPLASLALNDAPLSALRLNIGQHSKSKPNGPKQSIWWQPNWGGQDNRVGSGTFVIEQ